MAPSGGGEAISGWRQIVLGLGRAEEGLTRGLLVLGAAEAGEGLAVEAVPGGGDLPVPLD